MTPADRADELLAELTLEEKVGMLHQWSPAVERLGLPAFRTGAEVLHGVAWLGEATVFPQPVGMAASWDPELAERIGAAVADELHAKRATDASISLNVWAPVVDPLRHPLWGRNEEGLSEDPHLVADLATGYARGLRGRHPDRWRTVPTLKHLLAYNVEHDRDVRSMQVRDRVLHEYELPAFTGPLRAGVAGAVMPAYNLVNGRPAHTSAELIDEVRSCAPAEILVVSDAGAPSNLVASQHRYPDAVHAHAAALRAGIDSFTDNDVDAGPTTEALREALARGLITEADIDRAVRRVLLVRIRALDADQEPSQPLDDLLREHAVLAREAAVRAVVLLRSEGATLPVEPRRVAVVGPLADRVLPDWYAGVPRFSTSIAAAAAQRWPAAEVRVVDGADHVALQLPDGRYLAANQSGALVPGGTRGSAVRLAVTDWGWGLLTIADLSTERLWSTDSRGFVRATAERPHGWVVQESFRICTAADGLVALQHMASGRWLRLDASERLVAGARTQDEATWFVRHVLVSGTTAVAEATAGADLVLCALGNDPHLLGRETEDRPALELPPSQVALWEAVHERAPEAVLTLVSSYPYAFDLQARTVLWTAHSQAVGHGVIDIVSGDVAPSGRLPQTWWRSSSDAGDLTDYDIVAQRSTYWYSDAEPLFAFGHGLTGSHVEYLSLDVVANDAEAVTVAVTTRNRGTAPATEVVQVYTDAIDHRARFPHRLGGYARVAISAGEERQVSIRVPRERFAFWDTARGAMTVDPGRYRLSAGASAADSRVTATIDLDGPAPEPHRLPVRAASFDDLSGVRLVDETPERGTAVAGPGWVVLDDVEGLRGSMTVRVARSGPGPATVDLATREGADWSTFASAAVPEGIGRYDWTDVTATPSGAAPPSRGPLRVMLTGPIRIAGVS
jgi:beta-glucosidase